jgi:hypothetical protein
MILRIALTDGGGKWIPGTVLGVYPDKFQFNWGDEAHFLLIRVPNGDVDEAFRNDVSKRKKVLELRDIVSEKTLSRHLNNMQKHRNDYLKTGKKPDLNRGIKLAGVRKIEAPKEQIVVDVPYVEPAEMALERILNEGRGRRR